jgi:hypothetical protein
MRGVGTKMGTVRLASPATDRTPNLGRFPPKGTYKTYKTAWARQNAESQLVRSAQTGENVVWSAVGISALMVLADNLASNKSLNLLGGRALQNDYLAKNGGDACGDEPPVRHEIEMYPRVRVTPTGS